MESDERTPWSQTAARHLRAERAFRGLTQARMVKDSGIPRTTYVRLEAGKRVMDVSQMARVCKALGITPAEFAAGVDARLKHDSGTVIVDEPGLEIPTPTSISQQQSRRQ